ncbi:MAG TPA: RagB/SusD family nutrient uptake outer membrane protein [Chitinophagaceae bacterium]|nr:RagB/SusD family nutrient uptake outer membrane protein [Chitinophagaceae bacterium]
MKRKYNHSIFIPLLLLVTTLSWTSCKIDPIKDPNSPGAGSITENASIGEIQNLVDGTESAMRDNMGNYFDGVGVIGREFYRYSTSDPRFTSDLLGKGTAILDNNTFYTTNPFAARYRVIKNLNILISALQNTKATISEAQKKVGIAYAKTIQAYQLLLVFNQQYGNGIRVDVANPDNLGPFLSKDQSLDAIYNLLNSSYTDLIANPGVGFPFTTTLKKDSVGITDPGISFVKFNRAIAARVAIYKKDWNGALTALANSFMNLNGDLQNGIYHPFSTAGGDQLNPLFFPLNSKGETRVVQPNFVSEAEANDNRVSTKAILRADTAFQDGLQSTYDFFVYPTNISSIPIIRNEELILIYAEANAQLSNTMNAVDAINTIRNAAGLSDYGGATDTNSLIDEILKQRRYSLFGEGHRWIDMRRYDKLNLLPIDRPDDDVWMQFPRPANE